MVFAVVEKAGAVVMSDGEEVCKDGCCFCFHFIKIYFPYSLKVTTRDKIGECYTTYNQYLHLIDGFLVSHTEWLS